MAMRVQIPAYTDRWMRGDRYGEIVSTVRKAYPIEDSTDRYYSAVYRVKLDKSGEIIRVMADDCEDV